MSDDRSAAMVFEGIAVELGGQPILRDIHLEVPTGQVTVLAGCNGAGKTTLLRVASRVLRPDAGRVLLGGRGIGELSRRELAQRVAVVQQDALVSFPFSAGEVVLMGRAPHLGPLGFESRADIAIAREAMERLEIDHPANRSILELSGGERQLVSIARALTQQPQLLLLDEPTVGLDVPTRQAIVAHVHRLAREDGVAVLWATHLIDEVADDDSVVILHEGRVRAQGSLPEVLAETGAADIGAAFAKLTQGVPLREVGA